METMGRLMFNNIYKDKKVFITGHTGFKGSWLSLWLTELGSKVIGYSLDYPSMPNHFSLLKIDVITIQGDIRDRDNLLKALQKYEPDIVFHLAAQPLVRKSYINPYETFEINVMGTLNLFECCRSIDSVKAIINVTTDKCYENKEWIWGYRENEPLGGYDPYSASKACSEILTASYRRSFLNLNEYNKTHKTLLASVRAGNVIGGGDWGEDRLIPDLMRAVSKNEKAFIRNPNAIRPWQFVLEPLSGYLLLGQQLLEGNKDFADAWNFGPDDKDCKNVEYIVTKSKSIWDKISYEITNPDPEFHEATFLKLDCSKAKSLLKWTPILNIEEALNLTINWYKKYYEEGKIVSLDNLFYYTELAKKQNVIWIE